MTFLLSSLLLLASPGPEAPEASGGAGPQGVAGARADQVAPGFEGVRWSAEEEPKKAASRPQFLSSSPAPLVFGLPWFVTKWLHPSVVFWFKARYKVTGLDADFIA